MANLLRDCPFPVDRTLFGQNPDCSKEIYPYKNLDDITSFLHFISSGKVFPWMDLVKDLQPATDFCYANDCKKEISEGWYPRPRLDRSSVPKTILCHDYKGNYLEDRLIHGSDKHDSYTFYNWSCVDTFIYFSHNFVTVPTIPWINAAHSHGVPILGTIITEGSNSVWETVLESDRKLQWFADVLALIAAIHKFDGYLLNLEVQLRPELIPNLLIFLKILKQNLKDRKHNKTYLIWYDAVTVKGDLRYQNELTHLNKPFFDICDGIFLNYNWNDQSLQRSKQLAGERAHDVYVGVDVFGRGMFGGGGFNTDVAMEKIRNRNLSAAIFAHGWTEEAIPGDFYTNDNIFWTKLWPYLYSHGTKQLPFRTDFSRGFGKKWFEQGMATDLKTWFNLSKQGYQFLTLHAQVDLTSGTVQDIVSTINIISKMSNQDPKKPELKDKLQRLYTLLTVPILVYTTEEGFNGGGCLKVNPQFAMARLELEEKLENLDRSLSQTATEDEKRNVYIPLFICDFKVTRDWAISVASKRIFGGNLIASNKYPYLYVIIENEDKILIKKKLKDSISTTNYYKGLLTDKEYYSGFTSYEWVIRKYLFSEKGRILEVGVHVSPTDSEMFLGEIQITEW